MKKVAVINDLSGFGRCSLSVSIPILSVMGITPVVMPTAILSNHTGYDDYFFEDYTKNMREYFGKWKKLGLQFESIYTGFLGSTEQIDIVGEFIDEFKQDSKLIVDPVMGDDGKLYATYTEEMAEKMRLLVKRADIITPNITEACILSDTDYKEDFTIEEIWQMAEKLEKMGPKTVIITGIHKKDKIAAYILNGGVKRVAQTKNVPASYAGTGDVFASLVCGYMVCGETVEQAVKKAVKFIYTATKYSAKTNVYREDGISFEPFLKKI